MITNSGKQILAKYLIEQAPSYASHIAVGCGLNPDSDTDIEDFTNEKTLKFEMFRVPITSRGYTTENGISKIIFSAELPSQEVYYISEAGIFSSGTNPIATVSDSRMLYTFSSAENWEYHNNTSANAITSYTVTTGGTNTLAYTANGVIKTDSNLNIPFHVDTTDPLFTNSFRSQFKEQPRLLDNSIMISGGLSTITNTAGVWTANSQPHIHLTNQSLSFDVNSSSDEFVMAFSVIKKNPQASVPSSAKIMVEFSTSETEESGIGEYARAQVELVTGDFGTPNNGYFYFTKRVPFSQLKRSASFTWNAVKVAKVYVDITNDSDYFVILDGLRFNNLSDMNANPLYGMTSYSPFYQGSGASIKPVLKDSNTNNIIEIEFDIELGSVTS
jgi:hypothetical protein